MSEPRAAPEARPHLIFITTDTQGRNMVSAYGDRPCVETPHLDRMAKEGLLFENAFVASPVCTPSRGCWYTGLPANRHGAWANELALSRKVPTLPELLKPQGYRCAHLGKWHLDAGGYNGGGLGDGGFEDATWYDLKNFYAEVGTTGPNRFGGWNHGLENASHCYAHRVADRAIELIRNQADADPPLFLCIEFDEPHGPYICPPPFRGRYRQEDLEIPDTWGADLSDKPRLQQEYARYLREEGESGGEYPGYYHRYYDCNSYVDWEIGRVMEAIRKHLPENTLVIFTSDHGDHLGEFGLSPKGPTMYDACTAVPLILWTPRMADPGRRESGMVSSLDIPETLLDAAGTGFPNRPDYTGRSLLSCLDGEAVSRDAVFMEYNRFGLVQEGADGFFPIRSIRTREWKLNLNLLDLDELYHVAEDPHERTNRIDDPSCASIRDALHDRILEHMRTTRDTLRNPQWGRREWRPGFEHQFQGFFTTGYKDPWPFGRLSDPHT